MTVLATSRAERVQWEHTVEDGVRLALAPSMFSGKLRSGWDPYEVVRRCRWLNERSFDLIHGFESRPVVVYPALYARRQSGAPLILDWCDWFGRGGSVEMRKGLEKVLLRPVETFFEENFRTSAQGTTVINSLLRERAMGLGVPARTIHWLPNGASVEKVQPMERAAACRRLGLDPAQFYIGHLGQSFPDDATLMAEAFERVYRARVGARLLLIGHHKTAIADYLSRRDAVIETGFIDDEQLNLYLAACDLMWLPLRDTLANRGRWPMKVNDYMAAGRATVSTAVGDLVSLFHGSTPVGRLAADEPRAFASQTLALWQDEPARSEYEKNARLVAESRFAWPIVTAALETFYNETLGSSGAGIMSAQTSRRTPWSL